MSVRRRVPYAGVLGLERARKTRHDRLPASLCALGVRLAVPRPLFLRRLRRREQALSLLRPTHSRMLSCSSRSPRQALPVHGVAGWHCTPSRVMCHRSHLTHHSEYVTLYRDRGARLQYANFTGPRTPTVRPERMQLRVTRDRARSSSPIIACHGPSASCAYKGKRRGTAGGADSRSRHLLLTSQRCLYGALHAGARTHKSTNRDECAEQLLRVQLCSSTADIFRPSRTHMRPSCALP